MIMTLINWMKLHRILTNFVFLLIFNQIPPLKAENCVDIQYQSEEFRVSAGEYDVDHLTPYICQYLCKTDKFLYAAIMNEKYCLCSYTSNDYEINTKCCKVSPPVICDTEQLLAMEVNDEDFVTLSMVDVRITEMPTFDGELVVVNSDVEGDSTVQAILSMYVDDVLAAEPVDASIPAYKLSWIIKGFGFPGKYVLNAEIVDSDTKSISASDQREILIVDKELGYELYCPTTVVQDSEFKCFITIFRGMDLTVEIEFEGEGTVENYIVPDAALRAFGPSIPRYWKPLFVYTPPDTVYLGLGRLSYGKIIGFEYFIEVPGMLNIKILEPDCGDGESYCIRCQSTCPERSTISCNSPEEVLYSVTVNCIKVDDDPNYLEVYEDSYKVKQTISLTPKIVGYDYKILTEADYIDIEPGYVIAIEKKLKHILGYVEVKEEQILEGKADRNEKGEMLDARFLFRVLVTEPNNVTFTHKFSQIGEYKVTTKMSSGHADGTVDKEVIIDVASRVSGLDLNGGEDCIAVGESNTLEANVEKGSNVTLLWFINSEEWKSYKLGSLEDTISEEFECKKSGEFTIMLEAANEYNSVNDTMTVCCYNLISTTWEIETNSPKITPPGEIIITLQYTGEEDKFPENSLSDWYFGDEEIEEKITIESSKEPQKVTHAYSQAGMYDVIIKVYNPYDAEEFTTKVELLEKLGILEAQYFYKTDEESELVTPKGPDNIDIPVESTTVFKCNVTGSVEKYTISIGRLSFEDSSADGTFSYKFENSGEYEAECQASNALEESNTVILNVRAMEKTTGLSLVASKSTLEPYEEVEFTITFESTDEFTCYTFYAGDGDVKQAFGNEETCNQFLKEGMVYNPRGSNRKRRETKEASWTGERTIRVLYVYHSGGKFRPIAEAMNSINRPNATTDVEVIFPASTIWIEDNSTNINYPMTYRKSETFRLETTAILTDHPYYSYKMKWEVNEIEKSASIIRSIDISSIQSSEFSAIRFPKRFLDVGLYHVIYYIEIYENNDTLVETLSCFTYLEIISTSLRPMIIRGGASYILRGPGQVVDLEPNLYSVDPDDPEEKDFTIVWSCRHFDPEKFLEDGEEYDPSTSLSLKAITWSKSQETESKQNCLQDGKDDEILKGPEVPLNTGDLVSYETLYEIETIISKDSRTTFSRIFIDVIKDIPPSIIIMCEKPVACIATEEGFLVNPSSRLSIRAECVSDCNPENMGYEWKIYAVNEENSEIILLEEWRDFAVVDEDRLGIYKSFFSNYEEYLSFHIQVTGTDTAEERPNGVAKLYIRINRPPTPGSCQISSTTGKAMITLFKMNFLDWSDPEQHELRDYSIYIIYEGTKFRIHYGVKTSVDFILPPGDSEVMCAVEDELGAITLITVETVTAVMPENKETEVFESEVNMKFFAVEGKMSVIAQCVAAEAMVDEIQREEDYETLAAEVERIWNEYLKLPGIDSSYFSKEAREEIEEEVRDRRAGDKDKLADKNLEMLQSVEFLPFEVMQDTEVYGQAISALAETRPLNKESKILLSKFIEEMFESSENGDVAHTEEKEVANMLIANTMDCISKTLSSEVIGGNMLQSELEEAYDFMSNNITQPNFFILYIEGSRWEVAERVHQSKVEGVKNISQAETQDQVSNLKNITKKMTAEMMEDIMVGENPLMINTTSGLQITTEKRNVKELSGTTINGDGSSITLPDGCILMGEPMGCEQKGSVGMLSVKWSSILEVAGTESVDLSPESSTLDFTLTNREGNESIEIKEAEKPFEICLSISPSSSEDKDYKLRHVLPTFEDDDFFVYHQLTLDKGGSAVKLDFVPAEDAGAYVLFYGVGFKPALTVYDDRMFVKDLESNEGTYSILFGLDQHNPSPGDEFYLAIGHLVNMTSKQLQMLSPETNLTRNNMTSKFGTGYSIGLYTTGCYFFSEETSTWSSDGCKVHSAQSNMICCHCNHLTLFGSGFLIAPNKIDFSYVFANAGFEDNLIIYLTLIITFSLYVILMVWARWKDRKDLTKLGATPLLDNDVQDKYFYEVLVQTGFQVNAGTKSKVHFIISGEDDETEVRTFTDDQRPIFERGAMNVFVMTVPRCLGQLNYLRIWHDNSGKGKSASWYLKYMVVKDIHTGYKYEFIAERWLAVEEGDGLIDHLFPVAGKEQTTEFSHLFPNASRRSLSDNHLWFSVFTRPARSRFTRVQRLSCCFAVLYLSMLTSAMWYERTPEQPSPGAFKFGPLSLSPEQIGVGMMSNLIVFPPSFLMIFFFRKSRARSLRPSHVNVALQKQYERWRKDYGTSEEANKEPKPNKNSKRRKDEEAFEMGVKRKKKLSLPWWCVFISWLLVIASVGCSIFFLWAYGLQFGNERTKKWLTSLVISFISSVLLTEPIKIFCLAIIMACLCGNPDVDEDDADDDEEDPHLRKDEEWLHDINPGMSVKRPKYRPIDQRSLEAARKVREKEVRMYKVLKEIGVYALYLWILMILSFGNRDPNSYFIRETFINNYIKPGDLWVDFNTISTEDRFWNWTREALIPELFAGMWYNNRIPLGLRLLADDRSNFKVGYPVLRQVRAMKNACKVPWQMEHIISECAGFGNLINEDGQYYKRNWQGNISMESRIPQEFKYLTASQLNGFPFWGQLDWYGGGGYIVPLIAKLYEDGEKLIKKMFQLEKSGWIDKDTRAVFVEFGTYNAQVNLFVVVTIVAEFLPGGGIVPYYHIDPIKLLHYHTGSGLLQLVCQIGFLIFTIYYTVCELMTSCKQGRKYFSEYWNMAELANLLAAYSIIGVEIYKMIVTWQVLAIFTATEGTGYIKLQEALILDECFCYLIGFLMSLATLKFIKLLRFNKRIGSMIATLKVCAKELQGYGVCLLITFFAFVALFWLTLGRGVREFCSFLYSFESSISMMLKKFNYEDIEIASPIIGPLAFFTFALTASVILVNILLTIIIQSFEEVKYDVMLQNCDYELLPFIIARLKLLLGLSKNKTQVMPVATMKENKSNVVDSFSGKVDKLLDFINSVYLDERVDIEFLNKAQIKPGTPASNENPEKKKSRPRKIPRYQSQHMKKHLDF